MIPHIPLAHLSPLPPLKGEDAEWTLGVSPRQ